MLSRPKRGIKINKIPKPEIIMIGCVFLIYLFWAASLPIDQAPDEYMRFPLSLYIQQFGTLPVGDDILIRNEIWGTSYAFSPYGSTLLATPFLFITSLFTTDISIWLFSVRLVSVLCGTGTVALCLLIGRRVFSLPATRFLFACLIAFLPQFVFLSSYFNCDTFAFFSTAMIFYSWVRGLDTEWDKQSCLWLGIGVGLCLMSYFNAYGFVLASILLFVGSLISKKTPAYPGKKTIDLKKAMYKLCLVILPVIIIAGWFFIRNFFLYDGDFLGIDASRNASEMYALPEFKPSNRSTYSNQGLTVVDMITDHEFAWVKSSIKSFVGTFSYMNVILPYKLYYAYFGMFAVFLIAAVYCCITVEKGKRLFIVCCILCICIPVILSLYYSYSSDYQAQGRYIMTMIVPFFFLISSGVEKIVKKTTGDKRSGIIIYLIAAIYISLFCIVIFTTILPECVGQVFDIYPRAIYEGSSSLKISFVY